MRMFESKRLQAAFTLVTGILLGHAGTALYNDAQKERTVREDLQTAEAGHPILNLGTIDAYSSDNLPMQARISIAGLISAGLQDENNIRSAVIHTLKQQMAQKSAQALGVERRLDEIRTSFTEQKNHGSSLSHVTIELPQSHLDDLSQSLHDTVRHTTAGKLGKNAEVRLSVEVTLDPRNVERYYARKDKQAAQTKTTAPLQKS
jgi:hypothetical protein